MTIHSLPYPGYSWQITQHEIGLDAKILYGLLSCASIFEGRENVGKEITELMINANLLTPNMRDGKADAWRDYQQILPELGLLYSTRVQPQIKLTRAGLMFMSGAIGFAELILIQSMRLQYPNGHKSQMSPRIKKELLASGNEENDSIIELQTNAGILIKPGVLILRVLLELFWRNNNSYLTIEEILAFLLPIKTNSNWRAGYDNIIIYRSNGSQKLYVHTHARRNIMAWMKLLSRSDVFILDKGRLFLSKYGIEQSVTLSSFCEEEEKPSNFWIPTSFDRATKLSWFKHFGTIPFHAQSLLTQNINNQKYLEENYVGGIEDDGDEEISLDSYEVEIPRIFLSGITKREYKFSEIEINAAQALQNLKDGTVRRQTKAALHDEIVNKIAQHFRRQGALILEDRNSVDLLVKWSDTHIAMFEVKTASKRNLANRMRLAVGQLLEYSYRLENSEEIKADRVAVFDLDIPPDAWQIKFLNDYLNIGLLTTNEFGYLGYHNKESLTFPNWKQF